MIFDKLQAFTSYCSERLGGGPRVVPLAWVINLQKGGTAIFVGALMWAYQNQSPAAWTYLALHGTYGLVWLLKHLTFRDPKWDVKVTVGGALASWVLVLGPYWVAPWLLVSGTWQPETPAPLWLLAAAISLHTLGIVIMTVADAHKHFVLKVRRGLITDGLFARVRHPNYLGEMMIYGSYALIARHWLPWAILAWVWGFLFLTNMVMKERSMSRYPEWAAYKARTGMIFPRLAISSGDGEPDGARTR